jgi:uncharacterized protein involved in outer membrane biogenesis
LQVVFTGSATDIDQPRLTGDLSLSTASLRGFASWLGSPIGPGSTLGPASLSGTGQYRDKQLSVENAQLALDGNTATGALKVTIASRPDVSGTLAFTSLDLSPYFAGLWGAQQPGADWRNVHFDTDWLRQLTADIRLSAAAAEIGALHFGNTAASVSLRDARLEIGIAQAAFSAGSVTGSLAVTYPADAKVPKVEAQLHATGVDLAAAAPSLGLPNGLLGAASVVADVTSQGSQFGALVSGLAGTLRFNLEQGAFPLLGIAEIARASGTGTASPQIESTAPTAVTALSAGFSLSGGVALLERGKVIASNFTADVQGWVGLTDGSLGLNGTIQPGPPTAPTGAPAPFTIDGTLARPTARPLAVAN